MKPTAPKSALHRKVLSLLRELFPQYTMIEEHPVKVNLNGQETTLYIDICVRELNLCIECHGRQHFAVVPHFHGGTTGFGKAVQRDQAKSQAIEEAGMTYVMIPFSAEAKLTRATLMTEINKAFGV